MTLQSTTGRAESETDRNLKLELSFEGRGFLGYQRQPHGPTVEGVLLKAWEILTNEKIQLVSCSRLDADVDAEHFVANVMTRSEKTPEELLRSLNGILANVLNARICFYRISEAPLDFHARFHAIGKHYRYLIWHGRGRQTQILGKSWAVRKKDFDHDLERTLRIFEGTHDFSAFRSQDCQARTPVRHIDRIHVQNHPRWPELFILDFYGRGFLKNMIRNIVGSAVAVATGDLTVSDLQAAFEHRDRSKTGPCAPGHGLCLKQVFYDEQQYLHEAKSGYTFGI